MLDDINIDALMKEMDEKESLPGWVLIFSIILLSYTQVKESPLIKKYIEALDRNKHKIEGYDDLYKKYEHLFIGDMNE